MTEDYVEVETDCPHSDCLDAVARLYTNGEVLVVHPPHTRCTGYRAVMRHLGEGNGQ